MLFEIQYDPETAKILFVAFDIGFLIALFCAGEFTVVWGFLKLLLGFFDFVTYGMSDGALGTLLAGAFWIVAGFTKMEWQRQRQQQQLEDEEKSDGKPKHRHTSDIEGLPAANDDLLVALV